MITTHYRENPKKYAEVLNDARIKCKCGHSIMIPSCMDMVLCRWCGNYVFKDKKTEFQFRLQEARNNEKRI